MSKYLMRVSCLMVLLAAGFQQTANAQALLIILFGDKLSTEKFQLGINADLTFFRPDWRESIQHAVQLGLRGLRRGQLGHTLAAAARADRQDSGRGASKITPGTAGNPFVPTGNPTIDDAIANGTVTRSANYLTLPLMLKYVAGPLGIGAGGQLGYLTGVSDELISDVDAGALRLKQSIKDSLNTWDAGLIASLDFAFRPQDKMRSLRLNAKFYYGLLDTLKDNPG